MKLAIIGPPGAGKGTQAEELAKKLGDPHLSIGEILRHAVKDHTPVGMKVQSIIEAGHLAPDEVIIGVVKERLSQKDCETGYIFDGMPRSLSQARELDVHGVPVDLVILLDVPDEEIIERLRGRRICPDCGKTFHLTAKPPEKDGVCDKCSAELVLRKDDDADTIRTRLTVHHELIAPLSEYYESQGKLKTVDGLGTIEAVTEKVFSVLGV